MAARITVELPVQVAQAGEEMPDHGRHKMMVLLEQQIQVVAVEGHRTQEKMAEQVVPAL